MKWLLAPLAFSVLSALASPVPGNNGNGNNDPNDCHNPHNNCGKGNSNGNKSLGQLAARKGKYFGTEISSYYFAVANFSRIENEQFNQVTPENEGKWEVIHPQQNTWNFTGMDLVSAVCGVVADGRSCSRQRSRAPSSAATTSAGTRRREYFGP